MEYLNNSDYLSLSEFPLVNTLSCLGFKVIALEEDRDGKVFFTFEKGRALEEAIRGYWNGLITVEPKRFWSMGRELKSRMRSGAYAPYRGSN